MDLRKNILTALLLSIGFILHSIIPGILTGMKFDLLLSMIFVSIIINKDLKNTIVAALLGGFLSAISTTFPGGQIPNMLDKIITCFVIYLIVKYLKINNYFLSSIVGFIGTLVSGGVFLYSAKIIVGLPAPFSILFTSIVIPTAITNAIVTLFVYKAVASAIKVSNSNFVQIK
ncbi:MAG: tryptophan transporter [Peptostreptococcaceae bacterium]|jgi:membrane glycosyltransferase|nr:tryptophan transporter [Peptostreptococcaceae bacterium]